jgi:D-glycero-alpha-D-manno-heptose-7-phosphate kinase
MSPRPDRVINAAAPIRVCDVGGWTDTWFAERGTVLNIAVAPYVEVQLTVSRRTAAAPPVILHAENYGDRYAIVPNEPRIARHPILEAAVDVAAIPDGLAVEISIHSEAPSGCSTGTSAAVTVALLGALDALAPGAPRTPLEVARAAHGLEVETLGLQSGVQDQLCSAFGGINRIEITDYPNAVVSPVPVTEPFWWELERRLVLLYLGRSHVSSDVHDKVIAELAGEGPESPRLEVLRACAVHAEAALRGGDFEGLGRTLQESTAAQAALHPDLVSDDAETAIEVARANGCAGWKVNGAGGEGGSLTLLCGPSAADRRRLLAALAKANPSFVVIPTSLSRSGLRVWEAGSPGSP